VDTEVEQYFVNIKSVYFRVVGDCWDVINGIHVHDVMVSRDI